MSKRNSICSNVKTTRFQYRIELENVAFPLTETTRPALGCVLLWTMEDHGDMHTCYLSSRILSPQIQIVYTKILGKLYLFLVT